MAVGLGGVQAVFQNIQIERAQIFGAELHQILHGEMEGVTRIIFAGQFFLQAARQNQRVAVNFHHVCQRHGIFNAVKIFQIGKQETQCVADAAVHLGYAFQDFV